ncbi:MAG: DNA repair protein RadC [Clostridiales bacterium]|nr:DNA repair protein RadC [Clostridiales bacterium]
MEDATLHTGHRARLKAQFLQAGLDAFTDIQVLELLLFYANPRQDTNPIAHRLLNQFGTLSAVLDAPVELLESVKGVGENAALLLHLIPCVCRRYLIDRASYEQILDSTEKAGAFLVPYFFGARDEMVYLLCLDAKCKVLDCRMLSVGGVNTAAVSVRKIVEAALACNATSVVLAHNHTSGIALPSKEDEATTRQIRTALDAVGILLVDHIIVADDDFVSMADSGFFRT